MIYVFLKVTMLCKIAPQDLWGKCFEEQVKKTGT